MRVAQAIGRGASLPQRKFQAHPGGEFPDCLVRLGRYAGQKLEHVLHLRIHVQFHLPIGARNSSAGARLSSSRVTHLDVDWRQPRADPGAAGWRVDREGYRSLQGTNVVDMLTMISRELRRSFALLVRTFRRRRSCLVSQAGADGALTSDAGCAPGGSALLAIVHQPMSSPLMRIDIGSVLRLQSQSPLAG